MRACVCAGSMSVLVNGSPTREINIKRGLKQGDPLAPLLFLLVAEGLGLLMRRAVDLHKFHPFLMGREGAPVSLLQYADDTLCIGEANVDNLWTLKAILRGFELISGLKVNFWKSCLIGVNVAEDFMTMATDFLNCRRGAIPFKYLGLPVGANPRKFSTWEPMLDVMRGRLGSWGNKYLSLGGRIVMINAVLNAIPVFFLSYMKMPIKVWKEAVKIQRTFLWGGLSKRNKTCWVKWDDICKPKREAGLGIRDLRLMNLSLLAKWRWKLLSHEKEVWKDVIMAKYGAVYVGAGDIGELQVARSASIWWRDICLLDKNTNWFAEALEKRVRNGIHTLFWSDRWIGNISLKQRFPRIFSISNQQVATVSSLGSWVDGVWLWDFTWCRNFFDWEIPLYQEFLVLLNNFVPEEGDDIWVWKDDRDRDAGFTVRNCYYMLFGKFRERRGLDRTSEIVFSRIWKGGVPSKVCAFSWQMLLNRIQTKVNLCRRRIIQQQDTLCVLCGAVEESTTHLFLHCQKSALVWYAVMKWLGFVVIVPPNLISSFVILGEHGKGKREKVCLSLIWNSYVWSIWKFRNDCIFNNKVVVIEELIDYVKFQSWNWFVGRVAKNPCLMYEWLWCPTECFSR
jgi:hypothetical protein